MDDHLTLGKVAAVPRMDGGGRAAEEQMMIMKEEEEDRRRVAASPPAKEAGTYFHIGNLHKNHATCSNPQSTSWQTQKWYLYHTSLDLVLELRGRIPSLSSELVSQLRSLDTQQRCND